VDLGPLRLAEAVAASGQSYTSQHNLLKEKVGCQRFESQDLVFRWTVSALA
jgi:hypothetical protein